MSVFGRVLRSLKGLFTGTPEPVSAPKPVPIEHEAPVTGYPQEAEVTYPRGWNSDDKQFWDAQVPEDYRRYYSQTEWEQAQEAFEQGWMHPRMTKDEAQPYRDTFFRISTMTEDQFDWRAFREWYAAQ